MSVLLQISDTHFGTEQEPVMRALQMLVREHSPDLLVISGDITQRARARQFEAARQFVDSLAIPLRLSIPGNHDIPLYNLFARLFRPYGNYAKAFGADLAPVLDTADMLVLGVKTTRRWRHKNGEISRGQIDRISRRLQAATHDQLRVVVVHQPVHVLREQDVHDRMRCREAAVKAWAAAGADIVMGGHIHLPYVRGMHEDLEELPRRLWCVQAGTALSSRVRWEAPNSVNLLRHEAGTGALLCRAEQWNFDAVTGRFLLARCTEIHPER